jgi:hypothetical protein
VSEDGLWVDNGGGMVMVTVVRVGSGPEAENCLQKVQTYQRILNYPKEFRTAFSHSLSLSLSLLLSYFSL